MNDTTAEAPKRSWWQRLTSGLKRTSNSLGTAVADLVTKRKLDRAMLDDIEDVLLRADLGTEVAGRIADAVGAGRYDKAISADEVKAVVATEVEKVLGRLAHLSPQERALVEAMASSIVNKLIHNTMITLKSEVASADGAAFVEAARRFFNLAENSTPEDQEIEAPTTRTSANKPG